MSERRSVRIYLYGTHEEREQIFTRARLLGLSVSEYLRTCVHEETDRKQEATPGKIR